MFMTAQAHYAVGQFDGSADPNPGGRMGMGWHLRPSDGQEYEGMEEAPPAPDNTNNRAEYLALIALLEEYRRLGGEDPLVIRGDSQLVISQMRGEWRVNHPMLRQLNAQARQAAAAIPGGVRYEWVPRAENRRADSLASGRPHEEETTSPIYATSSLTASIAPLLAKQIAELNARGYASFKQYLALRVGGLDACSKLSWSQLTTRAGEAVAQRCAAAFPDDTKAQAAALRWAVRGLATHLAIKKVQCDQTVMANRLA
jgi:ribonuclease HI